MIYLLDSDMVNYILKKIPWAEDGYHEAVAAKARFALCPVVQFEVTRYHKLKGLTRLAAAYDELVADWDRVEIPGSDWDLAADLWAARHRAGRPIEDADLLIAVACLRKGATLVTNNDGHYEGLGLRVENWLTGRVIPA